MKKLVLILTLIFSATWGFAQDGKVPESVRMTFDSLYPGNENVTWNMRHGNYEANFSSDGTLLIVEIDPDGNLVETEAETPVTALPNSIPMYVIEFYPGVRISKAYTVTLANGTILYRAEVGEIDLLFDINGEFKNSESRDITPVGGEQEKPLGASEER